MFSFMADRDCNWNDCLPAVINAGFAAKTKDCTKSTDMTVSKSFMESVQVSDV